MVERMAGLTAVDALLSPQQKEIDSLLSNYLVVDELLQTRYKSVMSRTSSRDDMLENPPRFRFLSKYCTAIYDPQAEVLYEGKWSDLHFWIARKNGLATLSEEWHDRKQRYVSCDLFSLRAVRGVRVAILNTLHIFAKQDLNKIKKLGFEVMGPEYHWLIENNYTFEGFIKTPSALTR